MTNIRLPLVKLPSQMEQALYLICEELKSRKLFWSLQEAGIDDCYYLPNLDSLILLQLDLDSSNDTYNYYTRIMDKRSRKIEADRDSIMKQAVKIYQELLI